MKLLKATWHYNPHIGEMIVDPSQLASLFMDLLSLPAQQQHGDREGLGAASPDLPDHSQ